MRFLRAILIECFFILLSSKGDSQVYRDSQRQVSSTVVYWLRVQTHDTGGCEFESCTYRDQNTMVSMATGGHLIKSTSLEEVKIPVSGFCYARNRVCNAVRASGPDPPQTK